MKNCLVSLISVQTIPNILIALHFNPDFMLLVSQSDLSYSAKLKLMDA